ncbi:MAG: ABC transporter ATP-binding protein [Gammaproteobacteria bacterium]|nr:ABC transporter ATP-binding protein [Gammaproteobacteria bacterium]
MLRLEEVHTHYGAIEALKGVSLEVNQGEIVTLIGANGAGKSTLLMTVCSNPAPTSGTITYKGKAVEQQLTAKTMRSGVAIVPEGRRLFASLSVLENLQLGAFFASTEEMENDLAYVFDHFPILQERQFQRAGTLSGGEQQMVAFGRALMSRPQLLLMDEPSLGLAPLIISQIFSMIKKIRDEGVTIFLVEQNAHRALAIADRGYVLENGRIVLSASGSDLLHNSEIKRSYLGG